ncbi:hypothetical protein NSERUTF1_4005 [Nocardia seriolae]|nr:hypothetical protein NSERUTF1_4005 [Nocardia seriolae]
MRSAEPTLEFVSIDHVRFRGSAGIRQETTPRFTSETMAE